MEKKLIKIFKEAFNILSKIELFKLKEQKLKITDLKGYDSLKFLKFLSNIEKKFNIEINNKNIKKITTYNSIFKLVNNESNKKIK